MATEKPIPATPRRVFSAPLHTPPQQLRSPSNSNSDGVVETLYNHPFVKIISFTSGPRSFSLSAGLDGLSVPEPEPGTLEPFSRLERTIAVGMLSEKPWSHVTMSLTG
jgi:hypothetical protein